MSAPDLVLASGSAARRAILANAGVEFSVRPADVDEDAVRAARCDLSPADLAVDLAVAKACAVSALSPGAWVLGADQILEFDGRIVSKAPDLAAARAGLSAMRGRSHSLHSAAVLARDGVVGWRGLETAVLTMRPFSDGFLDAYLAAEGEGVLACVGAYRLEGLGAQLFERIEGDYFTVLGLPLWPLLAELRRLGVLAE